MRNIRKYEYTFIILSALIIALLNTLPYLSSILYATNDTEKPWMQSSYIITRSLWYIMQGLISVAFLLIFNYYWFKKLTPQKFNYFLKLGLQLIYNVILSFGLIWLTVYFAEFTIGNPFGIKGAFYFYSWKFLFIIPLVILLEYVLKLVLKIRDVEFENYKLKEENLKVQIKSLKDQINPHFLFNTLNTLSSLIRLEKKEVGIQFVDKLSSFYRYILENESVELVTLKSEISALDTYRFMLEKRFGENLKINIDIDDRLMNTRMPPIVLQHLVENAIKHNKISTSSTLEIKIFSDNNHIYVKNKMDYKEQAEESLGIGLPNLTMRYKLIAGKDVEIMVENNEFIVKLPLISS